MILTISIGLWLEPKSAGPVESRAVFCGEFINLWQTDGLNFLYPAEKFEQRRKDQIAALKSAAIFSDFRFREVTDRSSITFKHRSTDDTLKFAIPSQYDHAGAVAAADVNGDGLEDLYFTTLVGANQLWLNRGGLRFESAGTETALEGRISTGATFADLNNDGRADLIVTTIRHGVFVFQNSGDGKFVDITEHAGLSGLPKVHSFSSTVFDFNGDGKLDILVSNAGRFTLDVRGPDGNFAPMSNAIDGHKYSQRYEYPFLLKNLGGMKFQEIGERAGIRKKVWSGDALVFDADRDGFSDIYLLNMNGPDILLHNEKGIRFLDRTDSLFDRTPWGSMGGSYFDFDGDGNGELFVADMHSDMAAPVINASDPKKESSKVLDPESYGFTAVDRSIFGNAFYVGKAGRFKDRSDDLSLETYWPWGSSVGDVNGDGFADVFVSAGMGFPLRYAINSLLLNDSGREFKSAEFKVGLEPRPRPMEEAFKLDCEGADREHARCYFCASQPSSRDCQVRDPSGNLLQKAVASDRSSALLDLDLDGDLDLVVSAFNGHPHIWENDLNERRKIRYMSFTLSGTKGSRDALGAVVRIRLNDGKVITRFNDGKSGYLAQSSLPIHFVIPEGKEVESVEVQWPGRNRYETIPKSRLIIGKAFEIVER